MGKGNPQPPPAPIWNGKPLTATEIIKRREAMGRRYTFDDTLVVLPSVKHKPRLRFIFWGFRGGHWKGPYRFKRNVTKQVLWSLSLGPIEFRRQLFPEC